MEHLVKKYRGLDTHGKEMVDFTLEKEYERSVVEKKKTDNIVPMTVKETSTYEVNAAHADDYMSAPDELKSWKKILWMTKTSSPKNWTHNALLYISQEDLYARVK